jgi:hypothetical protein
LVVDINEKEINFDAWSADEFDQRDMQVADEVSPFPSDPGKKDDAGYFDADPVGCVSGITLTDNSEIPTTECDPEKWSTQMIADNGWFLPPGGFSAVPPPYLCDCTPALDTSCASTCDCKAVYFGGSYFGANRYMAWQTWPYRVPGASQDNVCELLAPSGLPTGGQISLAVSVTSITCESGHCVLVKTSDTP